MKLEVVSQATSRIKEIAASALQEGIPQDGIPSAENEIRKLIGDIHEAIDDARLPVGGIGSYASEKLAGLSSFALIAIGVEPRGSYSSEKILENIEHYSYLVRQIG